MISPNSGERHVHMLRLIEKSASYEALADLYVRMLRGSIASHQASYIEVMDNLQDYYIGLLEISVDSGVALVDTSIGSDFKETRRKMYSDNQAEIAGLALKINQVLQAVTSRKAQG